jgi:hypothetical protein
MSTHESTMILAVTVTKEMLSTAQELVRTHCKNAPHDALFTVAGIIGSNYLAETIRKGFSKVESSIDVAGR